MKVSKAVRQKLFESKEGRFSGADECHHASALFTRMVSALQTAFITGDIGFAPLFRMDDATLPIRVEANNLLFSTLELLVDPASPAADWMDSQSSSAFPSDGKRRAAHDLYTIQQWVRECYAAHIKAGTVTTSALRYSHGQHFMERDGHATDDPDSAIADLRTLVLDLKRQLAALTDSDDSPPVNRDFACG
ncbi:hypothetical protein CYMTET_15907 [Cymbomonas tetramitiformis]|uniref:Uncharacterized protein n=1 Tax=Cymbomonas tetramitiformis TaxID=36881 RepID=A0AAE0GD21_9CHLO|nr:hypothetical protein CYMTET_15907 [Cymbomonas tetramitiformis]